MLKRPRTAKFPKPEKAGQDVAIAASNHTVLEIEGRLACSACRSSVYRTCGSTLISEWLGAPCIPVPTAFSRPEPLGCGCYQLGTQVSHHSHTLYIYRGFFFCNKCGCRGVVKLHLLAQPCSPPSSAGLAALRAIRRGVLPQHSGHRWPCDPPPRFSLLLSQRHPHVAIGDTEASSSSNPPVIG